MSGETDQRRSPHTRPRQNLLESDARKVSSFQRVIQVSRPRSVGSCVKRCEDPKYAEEHCRAFLLYNGMIDI
jgi:hypothetical protein